MSRKKTYKPEIFLFYIFIFAGISLLVTDTFRTDSFIYPTDSFIYPRLFGAVYGTSILIFLCRKISNGNYLTLFDLLLFSSGLMFGFGTMFTLEDSLMVSELAKKDILYALLLTVMGLICFYLGYRCLGKWLDSVAIESSVAVLIERIRGISSTTLIVLIFLRIYLLAFQMSYGLVFSGIGDVMTDVGTFPSVILILSFSLRPFLVFISIYLAIGKHRSAKILASILIGIEVLAGFLEGRRVLISILFMALLVVSSRMRRLQFRHVVCGLVITAILLTLIWPFFLHTRNVAFSSTDLISTPYGDRARLMRAEIFPLAWNTYDFHDGFRADSDYYGNVRTRGYILAPLQETIEAVRNGANYLHGEVFMRATLLALPRFLWSDKISYFDEHLPPEQMIQDHYSPQPLIDSASTLILDAYADGGLLGIAIYMVSFGALIAILQNFLLKVRCVLIGLYILGLCSNWLLLPERSLESVLGDLRIIFLLLILDRLLGIQLNKLTLKHATPLRPI